MNNRIEEVEGTSVVRPPSFNVAEQPWIPVLGSDGAYEVSLRQALAQASEIHSLSTADPLVYTPLLRLLLALVLRTHSINDERDLERVWRIGKFDMVALDAYLEQTHDRFEVFHPQHPFLQVANLQPAGGLPKKASALQLHVASGNNVPLFSAVTEGDDVLLTIPEALRCLVALLAYDTAAIKTGAVGDPMVKGGKTTGNPTGPLGQLGAVVLSGRTLFETLLLNLPLMRTRPADRPNWETTLGPGWATRAPLGVMDLFTWPSRRVRMVPDTGGTRILGAVVAAGDRMLFTPPDLEPHCRWRDTKGRAEVAQRPMRWQSGSQAWRGLSSLLALASEGDEHTAKVISQLAATDEWLDEIEPQYPLGALCIGVTYGNQSAVIEDVFVGTLPLPLAAVRAGTSEVRNALAAVGDEANQVRQALNSLADNLRQLQGGERPDWDKGTHAGNDAMALLTEPTIRLLLGLRRDPGRLEPGILAWELSVERIAWGVATPLLDSAPPSTFAGRVQKWGKEEHVVRLADVEAWFRTALAEALPGIKNQRIIERTAS